MAVAEHAVAHNDGHHEGHHTSTPIDTRKLSMWVFLASECLFFGTLISTYLIFKERGPHEPGPELFDIPLTSTSTFVLLMSSLAMVLAVYGAQQGRLQMMKLWLAVTALLGLGFLGFQVYEFRHFAHEGLTLATNNFGASFYMMTGFHGVHVGVGVLLLLSILAGSFRRNGLGRETGMNVELVGLYWHFVDIVWIVIFTVVYLIPT